MAKGATPMSSTLPQIALSASALASVVGTGRLMFLHSRHGKHAAAGTARRVLLSGRHRKRRTLPRLVFVRHGTYPRRHIRRIYSRFLRRRVIPLAPVGSHHATIRLAV